MTEANGDSWCPLVFSGPSGAGKSTLINQLMSEYENRFSFSVSHTTRKPRAGEEDGKHYHFITKEEFEAGLEKNEFLEYTQFSGNYYGTSKRAVEDVRAGGCICILDIDVKGVQSIKKLGYKAYFVFVQPPNLQVLEERLRKRGSETEETLQRRLESAEAAMKLAAVPGVYDLIITNDCIANSYMELKTFMKERFPLNGKP